MKKAYFICPVRNATSYQNDHMKLIVAKLEADGYQVHFPPRDVDQSNDDGGVRICYEHRETMMDCDTIVIWWDPKSTGSHFDLGMAYMLAMFKEVLFIDPGATAKRVDEKSFQNVAANLVEISKVSPMHESALPVDPERDSGDGFLSMLGGIAREDVVGLKKAAQSYGPSWKRRGGVGAFMMLARKWDRMEERLKKLGREFTYNIFHGIWHDERGEGLIDDVRDLRRYLMLVEAEMRARGFKRGHRDNQPTPNIQQMPRGCTCKTSPSKGHSPGCPRAALA